jgi:hypothetical protein
MDSNSRFRHKPHGGHHPAHGTPAAGGFGGSALRSLHGNSCCEAWPGEEERRCPGHHYTEERRSAKLGQAVAARGNGGMEMTTRPQGAHQSVSECGMALRETSESNARVEKTTARRDGPTHQGQGASAASTQGMDGR